MTFAKTKKQNTKIIIAIRFVTRSEEINLLRKIYSGDCLS